VGLKDGALVVRFGSTDFGNIERMAVCGSARLDCFAELADAVERRPEETGLRRVSPHPLQLS
jgi:hypothetical protein